MSSRTKEAVKQTKPDRQPKSDRRQADSTQQSAKPGAVEWTAGGVSAAIVVAMITFLLYQAISTTTAVPRLSVEVDQIQAVGEAFQVRFRVLNQGDATAASVLIQGQLMSEEGPVEEREVTIDYAPAHSEKRAALLFSHNPENYRLVLEPEGYKRP